MAISMAMIALGPNARPSAAAIQAELALVSNRQSRLNRDGS
jgi:hypothetical protein